MGLECSGHGRDSLKRVLTVLAVVAGIARCADSFSALIWENGCSMPATESEGIAIRGHNEYIPSQCSGPVWGAPSEVKEDMPVFP